MRPLDSRSAFTRTAPQYIFFSNQSLTSIISAATSSIEPDRAKPATPGPGHHYNADIETFDLRYFQPTWR